jgi:ubiquitin carboxyl-terminal hydrolase 25/28
MNDNAADTETTRRAVSIVAEKRNSDGLRNWLSTGQVDEVDMDIGTAYSRLGIDDRTTDEETTISVYELFISDHPDRINELRTALRVIGKELRSQKIETYLAGGQSSTQKGSAEWPVGLENIGNTCYLNSLLQYLFSIKPLRDKILLEYDMLKINPEEMEVDNVGKSIKRILSTKITAKEIRLAQECMFSF